MTPKEIIVLMKMLDVTQTSIADRLEVTVPAVHHVVKGLRRNPRIRTAIAEALGRPVEQIWPPELNAHIKDTNLNQESTTKKKGTQEKKRGRKATMKTAYQKAQVK